MTRTRQPKKHVTAMTMPLLAFVIMMSVGTGDAFAHKADVVGDYKVEIGWKQEPPIQGITNSIELVVTYATESDRKQAEQMHAMMGMDKNTGNQMNMQHSMDGNMDVTSQYDEKIIHILSKFDSGKIISKDALSQISEITNKQKTDDSTVREIQDLLDDVNAGDIESEDAVYILIDMFGTESTNMVEHMKMMDHSDMSHDEHSDTKMHGSTKSTRRDNEGVSGLEDTIKISVNLDGNTYTIPKLTSQVDGIYLGKFTPSSAGYPVVHIAGMIHDTKIDLDMHPEEVEPLNTLSPLKQIKNGIDPSNVQCKEGLELFMRINEDSSVCVSSNTGQRLMEFGIVDYY